MSANICRIKPSQSLCESLLDDGVASGREWAWTANECTVPFLAFSLPFFPFTPVEFMRPLRACMRCQQCPANIFIQHRAAQGICQTTGSHLSWTHAPKHLRHLACLSISFTLARFCGATELSREFGLSIFSLWANVFTETCRQNTAVIVTSRLRLKNLPQDANSHV